MFLSQRFTEWSGDPRRFPRPFQGVLRSKCLHLNAKMAVPLTVSRVSRAFLRLCGVVRGWMGKLIQLCYSARQKKDLQKCKTMPPFLLLLFLKV